MFYLPCMDNRLKEDNLIMNTVRKIYIRITNLGNSREPIRYKELRKGSTYDNNDQDRDNP